jgi:hypothetical protein
MPTIGLTKGNVSIVDDVDCDLALKNWYCSSAGYACRDAGRFPRKCELLHRVILERKLGRKLLSHEEVDHINGKPLDNRRSNLRAANHSQNLKNQNIRSTNTSGYKGVSYFSNPSPRNKRWEAYIKVNYKRIKLGYYSTAAEAARAYDAAAIKYFGEFARLNFPVN